MKIPSLSLHSSFTPWIALMLAAGFFLNLWGPALFDLDEGAFSAATMEMLLRQDFITTYLNGLQRFDKPILIYWLQAFSTGIFGVDEFFYRLPSAIAASIWAVSLYRFAQPRLGEAEARAAFIFMVSAVGVSVIGRAATADALLNLWVALACMDGYRAAVEKDSKAGLRAYIWIGLGLLTKGPVAALVPFATLSLFAFAMRDGPSWIRLAIKPLGWLITSVIALPWYFAEYVDQGQLFIDGFFLTHNLGRFTETMESHGGTPFYYIPGILLVTLPFAVWLVRSLVSIREVGRNSLTTWCWCWFGFVFVLFSFSSTQLPHYVLYGSTPLFLLMSQYLSKVPLRASLLPALVLPMLFLIIPLIAPGLVDPTDDIYVSEMLIDGIERLGPSYWLILILGILAIIGITMRARTHLPAILGIGLVHLIILGLAIVPAVAQIQQAPVKEAALIARDLDEPIVMWRTDMPSFTTYRQKITPKVEPFSGDLVFTRVGRIELERVDEVLYRNGGILLVRMQ